MKALLSKLLFSNIKYLLLFSHCPNQGFTYLVILENVNVGSSHIS